MATKIYGYDHEGRPMRRQQDVVRDYMLHHTGKENGMSHSSCEQMFGFKRLSAIVFDINKEEGIEISREDRKVHTRYEGITSNPTFYWIEEAEAQRYWERKRGKLPETINRC